jgi:hypothetical protein
VIFPMGKCATQIQECICKFDRLFAPDNVAFYCSHDLRAILRKALNLSDLRTGWDSPTRFPSCEGIPAARIHSALVYGPE